MKSKEENTKEEPRESNGSSREEIWASVAIILIICITIVYTTSMYVDAYLIGDMIEYYGLRGKDVIIKDQQVVFIND